jgi:hypothetical protein
MTQRGLERLGKALPQFFPDFHAVDNDVNRVLCIFLERWQ